MHLRGMYLPYRPFRALRLAVAVLPISILVACGGAPEEAPTSEPGTEPLQAEYVIPSDSVIARFGSSHGMCMGYCEVEYVLKGGGLYAVRRGGGRTDTAAYPAQGLFEALEPATVNAALAGLDKEKFDAAPHVIGCPDCADGGRCWVELVRNGKPRLITFDCSGGSEQLKNFTDALWQLTEKVQWPEAGMVRH